MTNLQSNSSNELTLINSSFPIMEDIEQLKIRPIETKFYRNYLVLIDELKKFKKKNILDICPIYSLFGNSSKMIYEKYDCIDINNIKINSDKIFVNINIDKNIPNSFIDDMINNIKYNSYPNAKINVKITEIQSLENSDVEVIYSVAEKVSLFDEAELIDIYHSLSVLSINQELQEKIKNLILRGETSF